MKTNNEIKDMAEHSGASLSICREWFLRGYRACEKNKKKEKKKIKCPYCNANWSKDGK